MPGGEVAVRDRAGRRPAAEGPAPTQSERPSGLAPCLTYLFIEFSRPMDWVSVLQYLRPGMLVAFWGFGAVLTKRERPIPRVMWYLFGFMALMAWNVPWALNNAWAFWGFQDFSILVLGCVLPLAVLPSNLAAVRYLLSAYFFFHVVMAVHGLLHQGRGLSGWMGDENDLALALNVALGMGIYLYLETDSKLKKLLLAIAMGLMVAAVVVTKSRGGFVGLATLGVFLLVAGPHRGRVLTILLLVALCLAVLAPADYWDEVRSIKTANQTGDTGEERIYFWGIAWKMFLDHPVFGVGARNFGIQAPQYEDWKRANFGGQHIWGRVCHSLYFTLFSEQGGVGIVLFSGLLGWCFKTGRRLRRVARQHPADADARSAFLLHSGLLAGIAALLTTGAFLSVLYYPILWVLVGLMASLDYTATVVRAEVAA